MSNGSIEWIGIKNPKEWFVDKKQFDWVKKLMVNFNAQKIEGLNEQWGCKNDI